jgi:nucleotide-binding universal stress UspA family protein
MMPRTVPASSDVQASHDAPAAPIPFIRRGPVVAAVDANPSAPTLEAARALAARFDLPIAAIAALEPLPLIPGGDGVSLLPIAYDDLREVEFDAGIRRQLEHAWGNRLNWQLEVISGGPPRVIADEARRRGASVIVMGKGRHSAADRVMGGEMTLRVAMLASTPVFAVAADFEHLPRNAVVGVDFSVTSLVAARTALALLEPGYKGTSTLTLVHVRPQTPIGSGGWIEDYDAAAHTRFARFVEVLSAGQPENVHISTHILDGPAVQTLLQTLSDTGSDLLAVGTRGPNWWERLFIGSTATAALRRSPRSVLIAPPPPALERIRLELALEGRSTIGKAHDWGVALDEFSARNVGRKARLEIVDPALGLPTVQVEDYVFLGATFDEGSWRVTLMMSDATQFTQHLSHAISDVQAIDIVEGGDGRHRALLVEDLRGHAVLTFTD